MNEQHSTIQERIAAAINSGKIKMLPRWHFVVRAVLMILGIILAVLALLYVASFIVFALKENGGWFAPGFGFRGVPLLLGSLPWLLIAIALMFIVVLEILVHKYSFGYRKPLLLSALVIMAAAGTGAVILARTPLHNELFRRAREGTLPLAGPLYGGYGIPHRDDLVIGTITAAASSSYRIETPRDETLEVFVTDDTDIPAGSSFVLGDTIVVIGEPASGSINAESIHEVNLRFPPQETPRALIISH